MRLRLLLLLLAASLTKATKETAESYFPSFGDAEKEPYNSWLDINFSTYERHTFLTSNAGPGEGAAVFWVVDGDHIQFAVAVKASGWLGFGISEAGGMLGADVVTFRTSSPSELVDSYILEARAAPLPDDCNNWILLSSQLDDGWIILEMKRALDTGDTQDHKIVNDNNFFSAPTRLISAWGDTPYVGYHGLNSARNAVRIFSEEADSGMSSAQAMVNTLDSESDGYFDLREDQHEILATKTEYHVVCKTASEIKAGLDLGQDTVGVLTLTGGIPVLSPETAQFIHHFTLYVQKGCGDGFGIRFSRTMLYAWAPGEDGWRLPRDVGIPMFDNDDHQALRLEIHYNNPGRLSGQLDSSGIRFYYSETARTHAAAILELGDPTVRMTGEKIDDGLTKYEFACPGECSSFFLAGGSGVTVFAEYLHMHEKGVRMTNEVIRNNEVVHKAHVDVFEFNQQGAFKVPQDSYQVLPGDSFKTACHYRDGAKFGIGSDDEMCIAYVMYYPAKGFGGYPWLCPYGLDIPSPNCNQELSPSSLGSDAELGRIFGSSSSASECLTSNSPTSQETVSHYGTNSSNAPTGKPTTVIPTVKTIAPITAAAGESSPPSASKDDKPVSTSSARINTTWSYAVLTVEVLTGLIATASFFAVA
mmetsp:Transcript_5138/g.7439  ORF Transcript_5138/g.7439 Transcript_5138/m.7439 type:complete len:645 (+) Transcript_5138:49-1983(+)